MPSTLLDECRVNEVPCTVEIPGLKTLQVALNPAELASAAWLGRLMSLKADVLLVGGQVAVLDTSQTVEVKSRGSATGPSSGEEEPVERSGNDSDRQERPASSPCPSSSSSSSSSNPSSSSVSSSSSSSDSSNSSSDNDDDPPPPANGSNGGRGGGAGDKKKKDEGDEDDGNNSDSSSSSDSSAASADESDREEDDGVMLDTDDEKDKAKSLDVNDEDTPMDDEDGESDGSSDMENAYPRLPSAPVDTLISFRRQAAHKELQLSSDLKKQVVTDARQRQQERRELAQRAKKKKKKTPQLMKRQHTKREDFATNGATEHYLNGSTGTADLKVLPPSDTISHQQQQEAAEDEWMVDCSCGLREKNYDDGTSMIQCDSCSHWVHAKCADKLPEAVAQEKFLCFRCSWIFDCVCAVRRRPNHDDGQRMVECDSCKTWQHTLCVGIPMTEEPPEDYRCPRCVKKGGRRKSAAKASPSRQRKRSHAESSRRLRKSGDASPVLTVDVQSQRRTTATTSSNANAKRNERLRCSVEVEKKTAGVAPPVPASSPPSTPPPPPASPPPPSVGPPHGLMKHDRGHLRRHSARAGEHSSPLKSPSHRKRGRSLGSSSSSSKQTHLHPKADELEHQAPSSANVTPPSRGKGLMLRGFSASPSGTNASSSSSKVVRPPLPLTPPSGGATSSGHSQSSPSNHGRGHSGRKRKGGSARDRLAKKLKIKKSSRR